MNLFIVQEKGKGGYYAKSLDNGIVCYIPILTNQINFLQDEKLITYSSQITLDKLFKIMNKKEKMISFFDAPKSEIKAFFRFLAPEFNEERVLIKYLRKLIYQFSMISRYDDNQKTNKPISDKWFV